MKKKNLLFLAAGGALFALTACSSDETIANNQSVEEANEISFRPLMNNVTRAADVTTDNLNATNGTFYVTAYQGSTEYFDDVPFVYNSTTETFNSVKKYYWPNSGTLDFFAYTPAVKASELVRTDYKTFTVTPSTTVAEQLDLVYANTDNKAKTGAYTPTGGSASTYGAAGVPINFRHAQSKIVVKVKNSENSNLKFEITGMKIVNVDGSATFTYNDAVKATPGDENTDGSGTLLYTDWSDNNDDRTAVYSTSFTSANVISAKQDAASFLNKDGSSYGTEDEDLNMILIPQQTGTVGTTYNAAAANSKYTGSYIALKMVIKDNTNSIVIADASQNVSSDNKWAMWPVQFDWAPGKKYTYVIDLAGGGYWELNNDTNADLDPILENAVIKFVDVTVDAWDTTPGETNVTMP